MKTLYDSGDGLRATLEKLSIDSLGASVTILIEVHESVKYDQDLEDKIRELVEAIRQDCPNSAMRFTLKQKVPSK